MSALLPGLRASLVALALLATSSSAKAQATPEDPLVAQAEQLATRGDHAAALALLRVVVGRTPSPRALGLLGVSALRQGEPVDAEAAVQRALTTPSDVWVSAHRRELNAALTETARQLGTVIVEGVPDGTMVRIAGRDVGAAPLAPTRVRAGDIVVEAGAARVTISVAAGATVTATPSGASATTTPTSGVAPAIQTTPATGGEPLSATATSTVPSVVFGGTAADAQIPASFTAAFPVAGEQRARERSTWTDGFQLSLGLGLGGVWFPGKIRLANAFVSNHYPNIVFSLSGGVVYGLSRTAALATRLDVLVAPATIGVRYDTSPAGGWLISPVLVPGIRLHPNATAPFYFALGARIGAAFLFGKRTSTVESAFGGELGLGSTIGEEADWDLGFRLAADNLAFSWFITLDRRLL